MFFEQISLNGFEKPRFENIKITYDLVKSLSVADQENVISLLNKTFGDYFISKFEATIKNRSEILLVRASIENLFVGFKLGYTYNNERFYSWLGAVEPEFRGIGIGQGLLNLQHQWCLEKGFQIIETRTKNKWRDMLILNIRNGFEIVGSYTNKNGETKIIMEKHFRRIGSDL